MVTFEGWAEQAFDVEVGGLRLAVHDEGIGPVVMFLHGYPSSSLDAVPLFDRLRGPARLVTLDLPGFGASAKPTEHPYTIHGAVDAVEAVWNHLAVKASVVVAHDYSVSVGQELLARRLDEPDRTTAITGIVWCNGGLWSDLHRQTLGQQLLLDPEHGAAVAEAMDEAALTSGLRGTWGQRRPMSEAESHGIWRSMEHDGGSKIAHRLLHYVADRIEHGERWIEALETSPCRCGSCGATSIRCRAATSPTAWRSGSPTGRRAGSCSGCRTWATGRRWRPPTRWPPRSERCCDRAAGTRLPAPRRSRGAVAGGQAAAQRRRLHASVWEKWLAFSPDPQYLSLYGRYDPGMIVRRHGHHSPHVVFVLEGSIWCGDRLCPAGTHIELPEGAAFGPFRAGEG